ncbi:hypothetical protein AciM339_0255 [Aciduliprofundum sp. MAR08-339]|uniref:ABC transporter permease n=1 Tax=Aciduliprofundum sp. (strain MAR08-339) TaxID=673860 RepID=UPI0002A488B4|nr:hypothetical protein AciM339_0255 [Aciduliprofundum sp. MAR08-339]
MNDLLQMLTITRYQFKNYIRSKRLLTLFMITLAIAILYLVVVQIYINPEYMEIKVFTKNWVSPITYLIILAALFFGGDAIAGEYQSKTGYFLLPNPIRRESILWGKYIASFMASAIVMLTYWIILIADVYYYYGKLPDALWYSFALSFLFLLSLLALTYLFSSMLKTGTVAIVLVAIIYFFVFSIVDTISMLTGHEPWYSITYGASILTLVFQGNYIGDYPTKQIIQAGPHFTVTIFNPTIAEGIEIMVAYFIISAILATVIFHYREMK